MVDTTVIVTTMDMDTVEGTTTVGTDVTMEDILEFPEEFIGYDGQEIWKFIHTSITFHHEEKTVDELNSDNWKSDFNKAVSKAASLNKLIKKNIFHNNM